MPTGASGLPFSALFESTRPTAAALNRCLELVEQELAGFRAGRITTMLIGGMLWCIAKRPKACATVDMYSSGMARSRMVDLGRWTVVGGRREVILEGGGWQVGAGGSRVEGRGWRLEAGRWRVESGWLKLESGRQRFEGEKCGQEGRRCWLAERGSLFDGRSSVVSKGRHHKIRGCEG